MLNDAQVRAIQLVTEMRAALAAHPLLSEGNYRVSAVTKAGGFDKIRISLYTREDSERVQVVVARPEDAP